METLAPISALPNPHFEFNQAGRSNHRPIVNHKKTSKILTQNRRHTAKIAAISNASLASDPTQVEVTWQIVVGAIAGVTPFLVAGIEFSKRIITQRRCKECAGSGLVLRDEVYFKCPECGGFLPWQSWRRFFWG